MASSRLKPERHRAAGEGRGADALSSQLLNRPSHRDVSRVCARCVLHTWLTQGEQLSDQCDKGRTGDFLFQKWVNCSKLREVP